MNPYNCTLYNCKSLNKLKSYLNIEDDKYFKSLKTDLSENPFKFFRKFDKNERELFRCNKRITQIHQRFIKLFKIEESEYLKSGIKNIKLNFGRHVTTSFLSSTDLNAEYLDAFLNHFKMGTEDQGIYSNFNNQDYQKQIIKKIEIIEENYLPKFV